MKISRAEGVVLLLAVSFLAFTAGWFFRGFGLTRPLRVETQYPDTELTGLPALPAAEDTRQTEPETGRVNLNTAGMEELMSVPGIGEKRARDIIAEREANGPYRYPEDLVRVKGIGEESLKSFLEYITTEGDIP